METGIYGWKARLGYAGPSPLVHVPYEFWKMAPDGIAMVSTGLHVSRQFDGDVEAIEREVADAVRALDPFGLDSIAIGLAPLAYLHGSDAAADLLRQIATMTATPIFCDQDAVVAAAQHLRVRRLAVLSPYDTAINRGIAAHFQQQRLEIATVVSHPAQSPGAAAAGLQRSIVAELSKSNPDALYIAGDSWPVIEDIAAIESEFDLPVITEAQAMLWLLLQRLHIRAPVANYGRLLAT